MANIINAVTSGVGGLSTTADASGQIALQTNNGTTALTLDNSQNATFAGNITTSSGTVTAANFSGSGAGLTGVGGFTLLGTMTATASTNRQYSISSLNLTGYKQVYVSATMSAGAQYLYIANAAANTSGIIVLNNNTTSSGFGIFDLGSGNAVGYYNTSSGNPGAPGNTLSQFLGGSGITNSTTTIYGYFGSTGTFTFTANVYGVK